MSKYFRRPEELGIFDEGIPAIISVLNNGRTGSLGAAAVHASSKGYRITLSGQTIARGATGKELAESFRAAVEKAKQP